MSKSKFDYDAPARSAFEITAHDSTDFTNETRGLIVGTGGTIEAVMADNGNGVTMILAQGYYPLALKRINATGTTATDLVGLY
jgi:hypothetical protein